MFAARGALAGKGIKLNDLNAISKYGCRPGQMVAHGGKKGKRMGDNIEEKAKVIIKKTCDRKTFWGAIRLTIIASVMIVGGGIMSGLGYFDKELSQIRYNDTMIVEDSFKRIQFISFQYVGPVIMGIGAFLLMIACVMTLESRDKNVEMIREIPKVDGTLTPTGNRRPTRRWSKSTNKHNNNIEAYEANKQNNNDSTTIPLSNDTNNNGSKSPTTNFGATNNCFISDATDSKTATWSSTNPSGAPYLKFTSKDSSRQFSSMPLIEPRSKSDSRELLQRFLEDQTELIGRMRSKSKFGVNNNNSTPSAGSAQSKVSTTSVKDCSATSKDMTTLTSIMATSSTSSGRRSIVAEIHRADECVVPIPTNPLVRKPPRPIASPSEQFVIPPKRSWSRSNSAHTSFISPRPTSTRSTRNARKSIGSCKDTSAHGSPTSMTSYYTAIMSYADSIGSSDMSSR